MTLVTIELDDATDAALRRRASDEKTTVEALIADAARESALAAAHLEAAWTPEAVAGVERAEAELAGGGGLPHAEVKRRTREMLEL